MRMTLPDSVSMGFAGVLILTGIKQVPASIAQSNKQWVGTCLYQEWCKPLLISCEAAFGYEQVAKRIANIRLTVYRKKTKSGLDISKRQRDYDANLSISQ